MIIDEITIHNFGVYLGRQKVSLKPKNAKKPIILIGGLNGVGKTTFMDAFQLALFGKFSNCSNRGSLAYDKYLQNCIHKAVDPKDGAAVNLKFRHSANGIERSYEVRRSWKLNRKNISETIEVLCDEQLDHVITEAWHEHAEQFLPLRISNLFFFDGEKIKDLADFSKSKELISTGINQLLGLDLIGQLMTDLVVLEKRHKMTLTDKAKRTKIASIENNLRELSRKRYNIEYQTNDSQKLLDLIASQITEIDERFQAEGGKLYQKREDLEFKRSAAEKELTEVKNKLLELAGSELPLALILDQLESTLEQAEIEEKAADNEKIYDMLQERDASIKRELKSKGLSKKAYNQIERLLKKDLKERATFKKVDKYLSLNTEIVASIRGILYESLEALAADTEALLSNKSDIEAQIADLDRHLANVPDAEAIAQVINEKEKVVRHHLERIERLVLDAFRQLLRKESLVDALRLNPKTFEPEIIGADGKIVDVQRLSAGERQLLAVSLLWGLAKASDRPLPTIIDTPLGRLDTTHRTHLVKRYFPFASHQVMLLSTDEEINEKYYRMVKPWVSQEYHLEFDESDQSTTIHKGYFW